MQGGIGVRGLWALEGKVLILLDGIELNEPFYGAYNYEKYFSLNQIKKIEIIRGPGSAIYGGYAELGVINIITKEDKPKKEHYFSVQYGTSQEATLYKSAQLSYSDYLAQDCFLRTNTMISQGILSDRIYQDVYGATYDMKSASNASDIFLNTSLQWQKLNIQMIADHYALESQDAYEPLMSQPRHLDFYNYIFSTKYDYQMAEFLTITPKISYIHNTPYESTDGTVMDTYYAKRNDRTLINILCNWDVMKDFNVISGVEYTKDSASVFGDTVTDNTLNGTTSVVYNNQAIFSQIIWNTELVNMTLGGRYDRHSQYGDAFVPRVAFTKNLGVFHIKGLAAQSFRAPSIENINLNSSIKPEKTTVYEGELGYQFTKEMNVNVNVFDLTVNSPIVYTYDEISDIYINSGKLGSRGAELDFRLQQKWGYLKGSYSYYNASNKNDVTRYQIPDQSASLLGLANHKVTMLMHYMLTSTVSFNTSLIWLGERYGIQSVIIEDDESTTAIISKFKPVTLLNLNLTIKEFIQKDYTMTIALNNVLNETYELIQGHNGLHSPISQSSRSLWLSVGYQFN